MSQLQLVKTLGDDAKHGADVEAVHIAGGKVYSTDDLGVVKYQRPSAIMASGKADLQSVVLHRGKVITGGDDGRVKVFDYDLNLLHEWKAHKYAVNDVAVAGGRIFTAAADCTLKVWDADTYELLKDIEGLEEAVRKLKVDGDKIFTGDDMGEVRKYSLDGEMERTLSVMEEVWDLHAQDNLIYTVRDRGLTIMKTTGLGNKGTITSSSQEGRAPLYVCGDVMAYIDREAFSVLVLDNTPGSYKVKGTLKGHDRILTALTGSVGYLVSGGWDNKVILWDDSTFQELGSCDLPGCPNGLAMTEDGLVFAGGSGGFLCKLKRV